MNNDFIGVLLDYLVEYNNYEPYQIHALEQNIDGLEDQILYTMGNKSLINSIKWYTTKDYRDFNSTLREKQLMSPKNLIHLHNMQKAFMEVPPLHKNQKLVVYRGVKHFRNNDILKHFLSTSLSIEEALAYASDDCCVFRITVGPGSKILPFFIHAEYSGELEILLDSDAYVYINNTPTKYKGVNVYDIQYSPVQNSFRKNL
jgi:hypothetical protein